jgi:hypothetical protein
MVASMNFLNVLSLLELLELLLEQLSDVHAAHRTVLVLALHHFILELFFDLQADFFFFILHFIK